MENLHKCTIKQLQATCREIGVSQSGNKKQLIERLEVNNESELHGFASPHDMQERISHLEDMVTELRSSMEQRGQSEFEPNNASSPLNTFSTPDGNMSLQGTRPSLPNVANVVTILPESRSIPSYVQTNTSFGAFQTTSTIPTVHTCASAGLPTFTPSLHGHAQLPRNTTQNVATSCYNVPTHITTHSNFTTATPTGVFTQPNNGYVQSTQPYNAYLQPPIFATSVYSAPPQSEIVMQPSQRYVQHNPFGNVKEIIQLLPEFNPSSEESINPSQFVRRVELLKTAYNWDDASVIFAVQQKMAGPAKYWVDSLQEVFLSWPQFVNKFLLDFPQNVNAADVHIRMAQTKRQFDETPQEYYYRMYAIGKRGNINESSIARHIVNGINDQGLKQKISNEYITCNQLLSDINAYCSYNEVRRVLNPISNKTKRSNENRTAPERKSDERVNKFKCFNCGNTGHKAVDCPDPQKKNRCTICKRTSHGASECPTKTLNTNVNNIRDSVKSNEILCKRVKVKDKEFEAFIDSGSDRSLIRRSFAMIIGETENCSMVLNGFAGGKYECTKVVKVPIDIDETSYDVNLYVVENSMIPNDVLLGRDVLCQKGRRTIIEGDECWMQNVNAISINEGLTSEEHKKLQLNIQENRQCFSEKSSELGKCNLVKMEIEVTTPEPIRCKPYRLAFAKRPIVANIVKDLLDNEIIRKSNSPYASGIVLVEKRNGEHRLCIDYRQLNRITVRIAHPMPVLDEQIAQLAGNRYFTTLDLRMGYHQIEVEEESKKFTAFVTSDGHYEFNRMPFGLVNAPAVFQATMNRVISFMKPGEVLAYLDDVIIPSKTVDEGLDRIKRFLDILKKCGLTLRLAKCSFLAEKISYLGHIVTRDGILPGEEKVKAIRNFKVPTNVTEVRRFLGLTNFFRKFVKDYAAITKPLAMLTRKSEENKFRWDVHHENAFRSLIQILCSEPVLAIYDMKADHEVHTDASSLGLAGVLLQSDGNGNWQPVFYFSRHCSETESKYHSYELEVLAVVETVQRFRIYLLGKPFRIVTDCAAITNVKTTKELQPRVARWLMKLLEFDCEYVHRQGSRMAHVDALSRSPDQPQTEIEPAGFIMNIDSDDWILTMQLNDDHIKNIMRVLRNELKSEQEKQIKSEYLLEKHRLYRKTKNGLRLVIPKAIRWRIAKYCHDDIGHYGLEKSLSRVEQTFWFPRMRKYMKEYIAACVECCYNKAKGGKHEGALHFSNVEPLPFRQVHIDHLGPFIRSKHGHTHIVAIADSFTKFVVIKAVRNTKTLPVINVLNEVSGYFGLPRRIISDRGTAFTSKMFEEYCDRNNIQHIKNAVRTPRANGQVERVNQLILSYLRTTTEEPKDWDSALHVLQWSINSTKNSTTGYSPNELIFDYKPTDLIQNRLLAAVQDDVQNEEISINEKRIMAAENIKSERERWKKRFDSKHSNPKLYVEGDLILIQNEPPATGESRKLEPKYKGPYIIARVLGNDRYLIEDIPGINITNRKFCSVFSSDKLKKWCECSLNWMFQAKIKPRTTSGQSS